MSRTGSDDHRDLAQAATISSQADVSLDKTMPSTSGDTDPTPRVEPEPETIAKGTTIGRYVVLDPLGSGTMGVVMSAIDSTLDRKVALKLVKPDREGSTTGRQRLLREAQAMARLSHPNVVTVFEVGTYGGRVFLAMEYVAGSTLGAWLAKRRSTREIMAAFLAAGHGLAAAHRAKIVHRDFKPANVLVASDGRVRVADFGLATAPEARASSSPPIAIADGDGSLSMTSTGAILGTPNYMAPEQHRGQPASPTADQFAFSVALYEALYGELPFEGTEYGVYAGNVLEGRVRPPPRKTHVSARIRKILLRGLAVEPDARYPDMDAMLAELGRDPAGMRKRIAIAVACGAVIASGLAAFAHGRSIDPCAAADQPLGALWDPPARIALQRAFAASGAPDANVAFDHTARAFDDRVHELRVARRDACLATTVRHEQSADLLDRRMDCLDRRAAELEMLIGVLSEHPDSATVGKAAEAAMSLSPVAPCSDRAALLADVPPPTTAAMRAEVTTLERQLDRADALEAAGKYVPALELTTGLEPEIDHLGYTPLRARVHFSDAHLQGELGHYEQSIVQLDQAGALAAAAHDDTLVAKSWTLMFGTIGFRLAHIDQAHAFDPIVAAAVVRAGDTAELRGDLEVARGAIELTAGDYPASATHFANGVRELTKAFGANHPLVANALANSGTALESAGRYPEAQKAMDHALAMRVEMLGADHASVSYSHYQLGALYDTMEQPDKALVEFEHALAIDLKVYPSDSTELGECYVSIGVVLVELDRAKEALVDEQRAVAIFEKHPGDNLTKMSTALLDLGNTYRSLKRFPEAIATYERARETAVKVFGADHGEVADILNNMALAVLYTGDHARARELWLQALSIREAKLGPDHPEVAKSLGTLAEEAYDRGDYAETIARLSRATAIFDKTAPNLPLLFMMLDMLGRARLAVHQNAAAAADLTRARDGYRANKMAKETATVQLALADALWAEGAGSHAAAMTEAVASLHELQALPTPDADALASARAWLAHHGR